MEADSTHQTLREYIWLNGRPLALYDDVQTGTPTRRYVHVDHLDRPVMLTTGGKPVVWRATYTAFGEALTITGSETLDGGSPASGSYGNGAAL